MSTTLDELLTWGHGPRTLEVFLEPTCPFSARAFGKFEDLLCSAGEDRLTLKIRLQSQPWHTFSSVVCRAVLAAAQAQGRDAAWQVLKVVFENRESFVLEKHASGPNLSKSPLDLLNLIEQLSGLSVVQPFQLPELELAMKWQARYARQNGIHATPTFMVDGLVAPDISSGDEVAVWVTKLKP